MGGKGSHRTCEICGAKERHSDHQCGSSLFAQFPLDENRCKAWLKAVGNEELVHVPIKKLHQLRHVCGNHFKTKDFNKKRNRLRKRAIPMVNLTATPLTDAQLIGFPQHMCRSSNVAQMEEPCAGPSKDQAKSSRAEMSKNVSILEEPEKKIYTPSSSKATSSRAEMPRNELTPIKCADIPSKSKEHLGTKRKLEERTGPDSTKDSVRGPGGYRDSNLPHKESSLGGRQGCKEKSFSADYSLLEIENRELRMRVRRLEKELADKESELALARTRYMGELSTASPSNRDDVERYRQAALHAERLLESREASHRQQLVRLENQAAQLRQQLSAEIRRRQSYIARSGRAARDVQRLRSALGDSLRTVSQDPALDSYTLEHEARKLDSTLAHSLPPLNDSYDSSK